MAINIETLIAAIIATNGSLSKAAEQVGCSLTTVYNYRDSHPEVASAIVDSRDAFDCDMVDKAESKLLLAIENGEAWAIKYALSTKGKSRGYTERTEIEHSGGVRQIVMQMDIAETEGDGEQ